MAKAIPKGSFRACLWLHPYLYTVAAQASKKNGDCDLILQSSTDILVGARHPIACDIGNDLMTILRRLPFHFPNFGTFSHPTYTFPHSSFSIRPYPFFNQPPPCLNPAYGFIHLSADGKILGACPEIHSQLRIAGPSIVFITRH